jgi:hypothetical protein
MVKGSCEQAGGARRGEVKLGWRLGRYEALTMAVAREVAVAGRGSSGAAGKQGALLTAVDQICVTEGEGANECNPVSGRRRRRLRCGPSRVRQRRV